MQVRVGDLIKMRDGRQVYVNDVAEAPESIFVGYLKGNIDAVVVSDVSEVVSILE